MLVLVSIIMPLYNAEKYVAEAIESVIAQTYTHWELILVNDGSTDNSLTVAKQFESDKIKILTQENNGASAARNFGYKQSQGTYIKFFDADDIINPLMLEEQVKLAYQYPESIISGKWGRFYNDDLTTFQLSPEECWQDMKPVDWICSSWKNGQSMTQPGIFLIPRSIINLSGLWNQTLTLIDDLEFFTRVILASENIKFVENGCLYYRSGVPGTLSAQKNRDAVVSAFNSIRLGTQKLLEFCSDTETTLCCANIWQSFIYEFYYTQPDLTKQAVLKIKKLGGSNLKFPCGGYTKILTNIVGWKIAKWLQEKLKNSYLM